MTKSSSFEIVDDMNTSIHNQRSPLNSSTYNPSFSIEKNRHISFDSTLEEKDINRKQIISTHTNFIHASANVVLRRYLSYFEQYLPLFINSNLERLTNDMEEFRLSNSRIHHKDDVELYCLKQIQVIFESIENTNEVFPLDKEMIVIDAFHIYMESVLKNDVFVNQCKTEQQQRQEASKNEFISLLNINHDELFHEVLLSFNRICHSTLSQIKPSKMAEILIILFRHLFFNKHNYSSMHILSLLIENYHSLDFNSMNVLVNRKKLSFALIKEHQSHVNRQYLLALDILIASIESSIIQCPYSNKQLLNCKCMSDSAKVLLSKLFYQIRTSTDDNSLTKEPYDCIQVVRAILKRIFNHSSLFMIKLIEDHNTHVDLKVDEKDFELVMTFFQHLNTMNRRCKNEHEPNFMIDYFATILFGRLYRKIMTTKIKQIFQLFIQHFQEINWQ